MATGATGQLGLALPVQGELSGTWGDTVNNGITQYTNLAIAATLTLTGDGAVTLANTTGDAAASNITSTLAGAGTVTAQFAIVQITGTLTTTKVVTAPSYSKTYVVVNAATGGVVSFKASGQTGISVAVGESAFVYYNGTDYVKLTSTSSGAAGGSTTQVQYNNAGVLAGSANLTFDGTTLTAAALSATGVATFSAGSAAAPALTTTGDTNTGIFFPAADTIAFSEGGAEVARFDSSGNFLVGSTVKQVGSVPSIWTNSTTAANGGIGFVPDYEGTGEHSVVSYSAASLTFKGLNFDGTTIKFWTGPSGASSERFRVGSAGQLGIGGATYGTAGQVLTSGGPSAAPTWSTASGGGGGTGSNLYLAVNFGGF
jgi:hypothetical protein